MVEQVERITEIEGFGKYITAMLEIDAFFVNEDRHTNNIAVIYNEKTQRYSLSPLFDQGLCIFADTSVDYPLELSYEACLEKIESKPFSMDFDIQLEAAEEKAKAEEKKQKEEEKKKEADPQMEVIYQQLEERIKSIVGTKVAIQHKNKNKGKIEIEYYSQAELERLIDLFESIKES